MLISRTSADKALYTQDPFRCKDGSQSIPLASVNDDYCDCIDGSDEPGI
jgi:protein kinase C substrate 80K-H